MLSNDLEKQLKSFINNINEPYKLVENVSNDGVNHVMNKYMPIVVKLNESKRQEILTILINSRNNNLDHGNIRSWSKLAIGIVKYLLLKTNIENVDNTYVADVLIRLSRWAYTDGNLWNRFRPYAQDIAAILYPNYENLYAMFGDKKKSNVVSIDL
jgi:hypothetical protein